MIHAGARRTRLVTGTGGGLPGAPPQSGLAFRAALHRATRPSKVLVEGPRRFVGLIDLLVIPRPRACRSRSTRMWRSRPRRQGRWSPGRRARGLLPVLRLLARSWWRCDAARSAGVPVGFCDLEVAEQAASASEPVLPGDGTLLEERGLRMSDALRALATQVGCRDEEDLWELLLETGDPTTSSEGWDTHHAAMVAYCALARRDYIDRRSRRRRHYRSRGRDGWHHRQAALDARRPDDGPVLAVVGRIPCRRVPDAGHARRHRDRRSTAVKPTKARR